MRGMREHSWTYGDTEIAALGDYRGHDELHITGEQLYEAALRRRTPGHSTGPSGRGDHLTDPGLSNLSLAVDVRDYDGTPVGHVDEQVYGTPTTSTMAAYIEDLEPGDVTSVGQGMENVLAGQDEPISTRMAVMHFFEDVKQGNIPELRR